MYQALGKGLTTTIKAEQVARQGLISKEEEGKRG